MRSRNSRSVSQTTKADAWATSAERLSVESSIPMPRKHQASAIRSVVYQMKSTQGTAAPLTEPQMMAPTIARNTGRKTTRKRPASLPQYQGARPMGSESRYS